MNASSQAATRFDVTAVGEPLLRYSVPFGEQLASADSFRVHVGGAESNLCAALAQLGWRTSLASCLPRNSLGRLVLNKLRATGIDTENVRLVAAGRVGTYYLSTLTPQSTSVIYDRQGSSFCSLVTRDLDAEALLDTRVFHSTGITPALSENSRRMLKDLVDEANQRSIQVSFDVNYREKLLDPVEARRTFTNFLGLANIVFCSLRDAQRLFDAPPDAGSAMDVLEELTPAELIVVTNQESGVTARLEGADYFAPAVPTFVLDRPGAGDALAAGVLDGVLQGDIERGLQRGAALASIALAQYGDMVSASREELDAAMAPLNRGIAR